MSADVDYGELGYAIASGARSDALSALANTPATPSEVAEWTGRDMPAISQAIQDLEASGHVHLLVPEDRRKGRLYGLTEDGGALVTAVSDELGRDLCTGHEPAVASPSGVYRIVGEVLASRYRFEVLAMLSVGAQTPTGVADRADLPAAHTSRAIGELSDHGLVELLVPEDRKKGRLYGLTERGATLLRTLVIDLGREPTVAVEHPIEAARPGDHADLGYVKSSKYRQAALHSLCDGPKTPGEVAEDSGEPHSHVARTLGELGGKGLVESKAPDGRVRNRLYRLTESGEHVAELLQNGPGSGGD